MFLAAFAPAFALDADTFSPAGSTFDGRGGLQLDAPDLGLPRSGYAALALAYAHNSVVYADGGALVPSRFGVHLLGGYTLLGALRIEGEAPIYPLVTWEDQAGAALGDLSLHALVPVLRRENTGFALAVRPGLSLPTGNAAWLVGAGGVGASLSAEGAYSPLDALDLGASVGVLATRASQLGDQALGSGLQLGLGANYRLNSLRFGAEIDGTLDFSGTDRASPFELHGYGTYDHPTGATATLALGTGLAAGVGAPDLRVVLAGGWRFAGEEEPRQEPPPPIPEIVPEPEPEPEPESEPEPDADADGVPDSRDECPADPGEMDGCPDRDGDGISDGRDACPEVPKHPAEDPARSDGCPKRVIVTKERIEIRDVILFDTGKATLQAASDSLLQEVANTINRHADLGRIEVAGHTDSVGSDAVNLALSEGRANAVVAWLIAHGVPADRLVARGYGEGRPLDTNNTASGRMANRRVEFNYQR